MDCSHGALDLGFTRFHKKIEVGVVYVSAAGNKNEPGKVEVGDDNVESYHNGLEYELQNKTMITKSTQLSQLNTSWSNSDESGVHKVARRNIQSVRGAYHTLDHQEFVGPEHEGLPRGCLRMTPYGGSPPYRAPEPPPTPATIPGPGSPYYVPKSDPEEDLEEDDDEDHKEDPIDYPADGGDDGDDEDEPSEDDEDDMTVDQAPSTEETESFETDESAATPPPHPAYRVTARISIPAPVPTPVWSDVEIPSLPLPVLSLVPVLSPSPPASPIRPLGYRAAMIRLRAEAASTSHSLPLPPPIILSHTRPAAPSSGTPPLHLLSTDRREDRPEVTLPPRKRLGIALGPAYEVGESSSAAAARPAGGLRADYGFVATIDREIRRDPERDVRYGITDSWDEIVETLQGAPVSTDTELGRHMTAFETRVRQDTDEIYTRLDDEQSGRQLLAGRLNMLFRDRRAHARTARLMETEARYLRGGYGTI
ncbi:hypothetical protein Tco_0658823 [Tanacetum coccineum]